MSGPTRGMVAGQSIKTGDLTREYEDGHRRIFGAREPQRGRWVMDPVTKKLVPAHLYNAPSVKEAQHATVASGRCFENQVAVDGTDIGSRAKRREYMRQRGLTDMDDFKGEWAKAKADRERLRRGESTPQEREARREAIGRSIWELKEQARRRS